MSKLKIPLTLRGEYDSVGEQIKVLYAIAEDPNHPEHEQAKELRSRLWDAFIKSSGGVAQSSGLANPYPREAKKDKGFVFR